jgi:hypothetical protein
MKSRNAREREKEAKAYEPVTHQEKKSDKRKGFASVITTKSTTIQDKMKHKNNLKVLIMYLNENLKPVDHRQTRIKNKKTERKILHTKWLINPGVYHPQYQILCLIM